MNLTQDMVGRVRSKALLALEEMTVPSAVRCPVVLTDRCLTVGIVVSGRILSSTVPIDAAKCFFNPPSVPASVSVTVKNDLIPGLKMPRLTGVSRNGLKFKFGKAVHVCPYRAHFPITGKTFPISTPEIFLACYCVARNYPIRREITKPQTPMVISLWFWDFLSYPKLYRDWPPRVSSVGRALNCGAGGRGFDSQGRTNTQGLNITEIWRYSFNL